jgi:hypothetical protein
MKKLKPLNDTHIYLDHALAEYLRKLAKAERRSLSQQCAILIMKALSEMEK